MTTFAVFGTGSVGQCLAGRLSDLGNSVMVGTRNVADTMARTEKDMYGNPPYAEWLKNHPRVMTGTFKEAASKSDIIVNCTMGHASIDALQSAGAANLNGKVLIDIANPLDFSGGFPPSLLICNTDSLGERIQQEFPELNVVKTLNTMNAWLMVNPALVPGNHTVFVSGNETTAKTIVKGILNSFGWEETNIMDLGDISTARGTEMLLPLWVRLYGALQNPMFNFHINIAGKNQF
ncbi:MAG: NAD(P)-binding domain-containing protein [Bacteroidales bacterium]|nr:NAD(P)-binding domain-containing protein [Bacteroidales bacterium]